MATVNKNKDNYFAQYKSGKTWEKNRIRKLERTIKAQPTNEVAKRALKAIVYRRKTPGPHTWSASEIATAKVMKLFTGSYERAMYHSDPKVSQAALSKPTVNAENKLMEYPFKSFFSIEARLQGIR